MGLGDKHRRRWTRICEEPCRRCCSLENSAIFALIQDWSSAASVLSGYSHLVLHTTTVEWKHKKAN